MDEGHAPEMGNDAFDCPYEDCHAFAHQTWRMMGGTTETLGRQVRGVLRRSEGKRKGSLMGEGVEFPMRGIHGFVLSECSRCSRVSVWMGNRIVWPRVSQVQPPNPDLPEQVKEDFLEAGAIAQLSPRGAAALLRLAVQRLCQGLSEEKNLFDAIGDLVQRGLDPVIQQALDSVRVIGNDAVHPGQMDLQDDNETVASLFMLLNVIAEQMISRPKRVQEIFMGLPEEKRRQIAQRDRKS